MIVNLPFGKYYRDVWKSYDQLKVQDLKENYLYGFIVLYSENKINGGIFKETAIINTDCDLDQIKSRFSATCRNEINKSFKIDSLEIKFIDSDIDEAYNFHRICEEERSWKPIPFEEFKSSIVLIAKYNSKLVSGISCYTNDGVMRIGRIFSSRRSLSFLDIPKSLISSINRRVIFEGIAYAKSKGCDLFDLGGIDLNDPIKSGISNFKLSFNPHIKKVQLVRITGYNYEVLEQFIAQKNLDIT
ncbi:MAG TPA: hypothetical protein PKD51_10950 [Saprospiraceae bacterium]|nr:hypothetical protein [Saprospiraceae bacterium]